MKERGIQQGRQRERYFIRQRDKEEEKFKWMNE